MANIFKINCKELYKIGAFFNLQGNNLKNIVDNMKKTNEDIKALWNGIDSEMFYENYNEFLVSINEVELFMIEKGELLKEMAIKHGNIDKDLSNNLEWRSNNDK